jgi:D-serine deaminase-like pyridoxal phosphate-dependent protein
MDVRLEAYMLDDVSEIMTPALLIYPELVENNIEATLKMVNHDPERWRPHIKTAKLGAVVRRMIGHGIRNFKCATTLELLTACQAGAADVLLAFAVSGANARRVVELAHEYPKTRISVLVESSVQAAAWHDTGIGVFIDLDPGMNRTGIGPERTNEIVKTAGDLGRAFRGVHWYDGHVSAPVPAEREATAHEGYGKLLEAVRAIEAAGVAVGEVITSGTPAAPYGFSYAGFARANFLHRISPGTVIYNDVTSLGLLHGFGYQPAAIVLSTVISHPLPNRITCDAGHKSVSADAGVPTCAAIARPDLKPLKPSEEHLPIEGPADSSLPRVGDKLYLVPRHVCPTVNNFDQALMIVNGRIVSTEPVTARGHESPLMLSIEHAH